MEHLNSTFEELLDIFPRKLDNLRVESEGEKYLNIIYFQKNTYDYNRNWDSYESYLRVKKEISLNPRHNLISLRVPTSIDEIYHKNYNLVKSGKISKEDKILLSVCLRKEGEHNIFLKELIRNLGSGLKGLGAEYYLNLEKLLVEKGFENIRIVPKNFDVYEKFWRNFGYNEYSKSLIL